MKTFIKELATFTFKNLKACIFAGSFFFVLLISNFIEIPGVYRYDFIFLMSLIIQLILLKSGIETEDEVKTIFLFHIIGFILESYKVHPSIGSWTYPEPAIFKINNVPLYSGFMYAAVGSYIAQAWRIFNIKLTSYPTLKISSPLAFLIYINFFTHHFIYDFRWLLKLAVVFVFWKTKVLFKITNKTYSMPLVFSFMLIGFFIWIAENISTLLGAWQYPNQNQTWHLVSIGKISSWTLLIIISFILVANLKTIKTKN